ncbi:hypothetical protein [Poriferisphaera sp. WC338]|uniref:hypothetical protein n=1 Tax=Poriferisphaera sp. WC338 TaxID=3425129 RepID=UPI003D81BF75
MGDAPKITGPISGGELKKQNGEMIVLKVPHTDYELHLVATGDVKPDAQNTIDGVIRAEALRVDVIEAGGRYIEPVYGRPRRVQGNIIGGDVDKNEIIVNAGGASVTAKLMDLQKAGDFMIGQNVSFDVKAGATFEQASA